jgi:hypothetical protein
VIKYTLRCASDHRFEGWFGSSADFDAQKQGGDLSCPVCGTDEVGKALMAPAILKGGRPSSRRDEAIASVAKEWNEAATKAKSYVEKNFEHVGKRFPEEARAQHYGEKEAKPIYGEASVEEVVSLKEEGVTVAPVPQPVPTTDETKKKLN